MQSTADGPARGVPPQRVAVVGAGGIGGILAAHLIHAGADVTLVATNPTIRQAICANGFLLSGHVAVNRVPACSVVERLRPSDGPFTCALLATQPPQVEDAARAVLPHLAARAAVVVLPNGLCEDRVAAIVGRSRVVGAVVAWGASMPAPGRYVRTSSGGFTVGALDAHSVADLTAVADLLRAVGPVQTTTNLLGARWSKLAINCAISTLGTIGGDRLGVILRERVARSLALEIISEALDVADAEGVRLESLSGVKPRWLRIPRQPRSRASLASWTKHALLIAFGMRYRKLRSSMLAAIERGRTPPVDFLNGEVVSRGRKHGVPTPVNQKAVEFVWEIARGERKPNARALHSLYEATR